jgi:hypothetical protein
MKREQGRDPRRLPNPEELRKTTEPFGQTDDGGPVESAAITRKLGDSTVRYSNHRQ